MRKFLALLIVTATLPSAAMAASWYQVGGNEKSQAYIDADSKRDIGSRKIVVNTLSVYSSPLGGTDIWSTLVKVEYSCNQRYFRTLEYSYYDVYDRHVKTEESLTINERKEASEGSINEAMMQFVCDGYGGTPVANPWVNARQYFGR